MKKEKPKYNIFQNSIYVFKYTWVRDKLVLFIILAQITLTIILNLIALYLPKTVVGQIVFNVNIEVLIMTILIFTVATVILQSVKKYIESGFEYRKWILRTKVSYDLLTKTIESDYDYLEDHDFTELQWKATNQTRYNNGTTEQIYNTFTNLGINVIGFIIYIIMLASVNPLVLVITASTTIFGVIARTWANKWRHENDTEIGRLSWHQYFITNGIARDYKMAKDIRIFAMKDWIYDIYNTNMKLFQNFQMKIQSKQLVADIIDCIAVVLREGIAYAYLIWQVLNFGLSVDNFVLMFAAISGFSNWITGILNNCSELYVHSLNYCRIREFLDFPNKFKYNDGESISNVTDYAFEFRNVSFKYNGAAEYTLENINLTIHAGEKLAIVGLNGAGKTTLIKLLCGFYDPTEGEILLNGVDIRTYNREQYYNLFTAVFQDFNILPLSIAANISQLSEDDDSIDINKVNHCLEMADLDKKINSLPNGINSILMKDINDEAIELSGGEMQKLMLARALYKDSPILILDEPTAALDPIAENKLYNRYNELSIGKTSVYISHRLASTRFCDRVIFINDNTIIESGTHDELLKFGGKYFELFEIQSKYYKDEVAL